MKLRAPLAGFACGVACTALLVIPHDWAKRKQFEREAWQHGAGYYEWNIYDKMDWDSNQPMRFKWTR